MARARNLKPSFFTDDEVAALKPLTRLLFAGLWCIADREGRLQDKPRKIKAEVLPYDDCNVEKMLLELDRSGFIVKFESEGHRYIQIRSFKKHQNPHVKEPASSIPCPEKTPDSPSAGTGPSTELAGNIPERAGLIPDCGFLIVDSLNPLPDSGSPPPDPGLPQPAIAADANSATPAHANGANGRRVFQRENPKAQDPWPRRIPSINDEKALEACAKAYGIDPGTSRFANYAELQAACFSARNQLHERLEREPAATHPPARTTPRIQQQEALQRLLDAAKSRGRHP